MNKLNYHPQVLWGLEMKYLNYYIVNGQLYSSNELYHYGVKGMKWGFRKYKTLYRETTDAIGDQYTDRQKKRIQKQAESILKAGIKRQTGIFNSLSKYADRKYKKADKLVYKSEARQKIGDESGFKKYQSKAWKQVAKYIKAKKSADEIIKQVNISQKRLSEIHEGKIKAGRDYVTNKVTKYRPIPYGVLITTEKRIDFKDD